MTEPEPSTTRKRTQENRTVIPLFDGWALEAIRLNWVVCRENANPDAPERWIRVGYYGNLAPAVGRILEELVRENAQAAAVKSLHELMRVQTEASERLTRALVGAIEELGVARGRI